MVNKEIIDHSFILKNIVCYVSVFVGKGLVVSSSIGLITVSDAILTGRQSGQKLQCLYGNPMAKNFFQNRILRKL